MIYQLPNGKIVNIDIDYFLNASDSDFDDYVMRNCYDYVEKNSKVTMEFYQEEDINITKDNIQIEDEFKRLNEFIEGDDDK